jgi:3-hydroxyacyl-[acyl-carrier-protein] dehydratase
MSRKAPVSEAPTDIDITEIMARIPHRIPFLLVDRCEEFVPGQSIAGIKCVTVNEPFFAGHFPDYPVMPGVLIVEAMAQTSAVLMSKSLDIDPAGKAIFFMSLDNCRFRAPVRPGMVLRLAVEVTQSRRDIYKFKGRALVDDKVAAEAEWAAMVVDTK